MMREWFVRYSLTGVPGERAAGPYDSFAVAHAQHGEVLAGEDVYDVKVESGPLEHSEHCRRTLGFDECDCAVSLTRSRAVA